MQWKDQDGKEQRADARTWVKESDSAATLKQRWVFAGSELFKDPQTGEMRFAADGGDLITVSNFISAILDVPFASSAADSDRSFMANTAKIPAIEHAGDDVLEAGGRVAGEVNEEGIGGWSGSDGAGSMRSWRGR